MSLSLPYSLRKDMLTTAQQMNELFHRLDRFMPSVVSDLFPLNETDGSTVRRDTYIRVTHEDDKELHLSMEMPGVNKDNLKVEYSGKTIRWTAHNESEKVSEDGSKTKSVHDFSGMYRLPFTPNRVTAQLKNGVLGLVVSKPEVAEDAPVSVDVV